MFNLEKAKKMKILNNKDGTKKYGTEDAGKDQKKYEEKVNQFLEYCMEFKNVLVTEINAGELDTVDDIRKCFNDSFKKYYKNSKKFSLFSRTTKVLKEMDKKLKKLGNLKVNNKNGSLSKIRDAFEYSREIPKNGYIKRSAIDDKAVYGFLNDTVPKIIGGLLEKAEKNTGQKAVAGEEGDVQQAAVSEELKFIESSLENAKFENRLIILQKKASEIENDLEAIKDNRREYEGAEKAFQKNDKFIAEIRKNVEYIKIWIESISSFSTSAKVKLKELVEGNADKKYILGYKNSIRFYKDCADRYNKKLEKLKLDTKKAARESNEIIKKLRNDELRKKGFKLKDNGTLIVNGQKAAKDYWDDYLKCSSKYSGKVKTVYINNVSNIGDFYGENNGICCDFINLTSVTTKSLSGEIGKYAFNGCKKLASFNKDDNYDYNIPAKVKKINSFAFFEAGSEVADGFSANVEATTICWGSFNKSGLKEINLPNATIIMQKAFCNCTKLKKVTLGKDNVNIIEGAFDNMANLTIYVKNENLQKELEKKFNSVIVKIKR